MSNITIGAFQYGPVQDWPSTTCSLRIYFTGCVGNQFVDSLGNPIACGVVGQQQGFYLEIPCTITGTNINIPSFTLPSTDDSDTVNVTAIAVFVDANGTQRQHLFDNWIITNTLGANITFAMLRAYNALAVLAYSLNSTYLTAPQVAALIAQAVGSQVNASATIKGNTKLSVDPTSMTNPVAVGINDPVIPAFTLHASKYATLNAANTAISAAGGGTLIVDAITAVSATVTIAPTVKLVIQGQGQIHGVGGGQVVTIQGPIDAPPSQWIGSNMLIDLTGNHRLSTIYPEWWGAVADSVTDCFTAIQAAEVARAQVSGTLRFNSGSANASYNISSPIQISQVKGGAWIGSGPDNCRITATGGQPAVQATSLFRMGFEGILFTTSAVIGGGKGVFELEGAASFGTQGLHFDRCYFSANQLAAYAIIVNRAAGAGYQVSEILFEDSNFDGGIEACFYMPFGFNALNITFLGGNFQNYKKDGISILAGSVQAFSVAFQSTFPYEQATNDGHDIHVGEAGAGDKIFIGGCRTESMQFFKGSSTQSAQLVSINQTIGGVTQWAALGGVTLHQVLIKNVVVAGRSQPHAFQASTAGTSGAVEPTWPATGTIADGSVVWTELPFFSVDTQTITGGNGPNTIDIQNSVWAGPLKLGGWVFSQAVANGDALTTTFTYQPAFWQFPRYYTPLDATGGNFTVTLNAAPLGTVIFFKRVDSTANIVTLVGGSVTIDGAATIRLKGGDNRQYVGLVYQGGLGWIIIAKSDAASVNGLTQGEGTALTVSSNTIAPTNAIHQVGAGLVKTITVPSGLTSGTIALVPTAAFTYDATGNVLGTGTAVVGRTMFATLSSSTGKWSMSY